MLSDEQQWATELKQSQQKAARNARVPLAIQKKQNADVLAYAKSELLKALREKRSEAIEAILDKLFAIRAEQTAIEISEIKELYGYVEPRVVEAELKKYYIDCLRLQRSVQSRG